MFTFPRTAKIVPLNTHSLFLHITRPGNPLGPLDPQPPFCHLKSCAKPVSKSCITPEYPVLITRTCAKTIHTLHFIHSVSTTYQQVIHQNYIDTTPFSRYTYGVLAVFYTQFPLLLLLLDLDSNLEKES